MITDPFDVAAITAQQSDDAELIKSLDRPAWVITANTSIPVEVVTAWLATGRWGAATKQQAFAFDAGENEPREMTKPAIATRHESGLHLFSQAGDKPASTSNNSQQEPRE